MNYASTPLVVVLLAFVLVGCQSTRPQPRAWDLVINKTTPASIEVDLIGVSEIEKPAWQGYDIDQYWTAGDSRRTNADKLSSNLVTGQPWVIRRDNPQWRQWLDRGATELLIIANLPGNFAPGPTDPRRIFIPLDKRHWNSKGQMLQIEVQDTIVRPTAP